MRKHLRATILALSTGHLVLACAPLEPKDNGTAASSDLTGKKFSDDEFRCITAAALADPESVTYDEHIKPLLAAKCVSCHKPTLTPPDLSTYAAAVAAGGASDSEIQAGSMPQGGTMTAAEKQMFSFWVDAGFPEKAVEGGGDGAPAGDDQGEVGSGDGVPAADAGEDSANGVHACRKRPAATGASDDGAGDDGASDGPVNYNDNIKALLAANCVSCHSPAGQIAPDLSDFAKAKLGGARSNFRIANGTMPTAGALSTADRALFKAWVDGGYLEAAP